MTKSSALSSHFFQVFYFFYLVDQHALSDACNDANVQDCIMTISMGYAVNDFLLKETYWAIWKEP